MTDWAFIALLLCDKACRASFGGLGTGCYARPVCQSHGARVGPAGRWPPSQGGRGGPLRPRPAKPTAGSGMRFVLGGSSVMASEVGLVSALPWEQLGACQPEQQTLILNRLSTAMRLINLP